AQSNLDYLREFARNLPDKAAAAARDSDFAQEYRERFLEALNNDLNTPQALAAALELVAEAYRRGDKGIWNTLMFFDRVMGLGLEKSRAASQDAAFPPDVQALI